MKAHYIFIEYDAGIRFDFANIANPNAYSMYLIISEKNYASLSQAAKFSFDEIYVIDESKFNFPSLLAKINEFVTQYSISLDDLAIVTHDEYSLGMCAKLREYLELEGDRFDEVVKFTNKLIMKDAIADLRKPKHMPFIPHEYNINPQTYLDNALDTLGLPLFIKPINRASCFETEEIYSKQQLANWMQIHKDCDYFELDEFIHGKLYHCDSVIHNGEIKHVFVSEYSHPCAEIKKGKSIGSIIVQDNHPFYADILDYNNKVLSTMKTPRNTVTHFEFFRAQHGEFVFLEIAARAPGAETPFAYQLMTDKNVEEVLVRLQMGLAVDLTFDNKGLYAAFMRFPKLAGTVESLIKPKISSHYHLQYSVQPGDQLDASENFADTSAVMLMWHKDYDVLHKDFYQLSEFVPFKLRNEAVLLKEAC